MELKFDFTDEVVALNILQLFVVITIKDLNFELFLLLEVIVDGDLLNPSWIQIVMDDLSLTDLLPETASL